MDIQVIRARTQAELDLAYQCHHDWFAEAGYITPISSRRYTDSFTARSAYFLALSGEQPVGLVRAVEQAPFRTLTEFEIDAKYRDYDFSDENCVESSALCWRANWGLPVLPHLYRALCQHSLLKGKRTLICNLDDRVVRITRRMGFPITIIGKTQYYMGSSKTPVMMERATILSYFDQHRHNPLVNLLQTPLDD